MYEETHPMTNVFSMPRGHYENRPSWSIGMLDADYRSGVVATCWAMSGDDIALYRAGVERAL